MMQTHALFFPPSSVFVFHRHTALLNLNHVAQPPTPSCNFVFICLSSLVLFPHLRISPCCFSFPSNRSASSFAEAASASLSGQKRRMEEWGWKVVCNIREHKPNVMPLCSHGVKWAYRWCNFNDGEDDRDEMEWDEKLNSSLRASLSSSLSLVSDKAKHSKLFECEQSQQSKMELMCKIE